MASTSTVPANPPNHDGMLLVEAPFARVPYDELRRQLRTQQRLIERDLTFCSTNLENLAKNARSGASLSIAPHTGGSNTPANFSSGTQSRDGADEDGDTSIVDASLLADVSFASQQSRNIVDDTSLGEAERTGTELERSLDVMIGRIKGMKRKLTSVHESSGSTLTRLEARTNHLQDLHGIQNVGSHAFDEWFRTRLDRMLVDWMLRKGFRKSAEILAFNRNIQDYVDLDLFAEMARIEASLMQVEQNSSSKPSCAATLAWCSENKAALRKIHSTLEFDLRVQEFIELNRTRTPQSLQEAITYSRKHLLPLLAATKENSGKAIGENITSTSNNIPTVGTSKIKDEDKDDLQEKELQESLRKQVARVMGALACGPNGWAYSDLYDSARWDQLRVKFRSAALQIHSLPTQPLLHIALSAGLSSLKLPACYGDSSNTNVQPPAHLGGPAFGDDSANILSVSGVTSVSAPPIFPPAAGVLQEPPSVVLTMTENEGGTASAATATTTTAIGPISQLSTDSTSPSLLQKKNENCPVCDTRGLNILAKEVPWSHHANSTLVCSISGRIMDENDPPMVLPNGRVYCLSALQELAASSEDGSSITCPRTGQIFPFKSSRKAYIS